MATTKCANCVSRIVMRQLSYGEAIREAFEQTMERDPSVFLIGQGVVSPWYVGNTTKGLAQKFGVERVIDTPVAENGITGVALGAAIAGMKPVVIHPRMDFMLLACEQIINQAANWRYMFGGKAHASLTIRAIINRGGEQGCQHSQALQTLFAHIPGLKVVMPSTAYDAKGLLVSAINDPDPVMYIDDRWLYGETSDVPKQIYAIPFGEGTIEKKGKDLTVIGISSMLPHAMQAAKELEKKNISIEVINLRSLKPLDENIIFESVKKTGRLVIAEASWKTGGFAGEIAARVQEVMFTSLKAPVMRVCLPDTPAPMSVALEKRYYPDEKNIVQAIKTVINF